MSGSIGLSMSVARNSCRTRSLSTTEKRMSIQPSTSLLDVTRRRGSLVALNSRDVGMTEIVTST